MKTIMMAGIFVLFVGVIVAVLFATGVLGKKKDDPPGGGSKKVVITKAMYQGICSAGGDTRGDGSLDMTKGLDVTERLQKAVDNSDDLSQLGCVNPPAGKCPTNGNYSGNTSWWDNTDVGLGPQTCQSQYQFIVVEWTLNGVTKGPKKFIWGTPIDLVNA